MGQAAHSTEHYEELRSVLGKRIVRNRIDSAFDFIIHANRGLSAEMISNFRKYFNLPLNETADILNISEPTIYRWTKENKKLDRNFSVQLFEVSSLFLYGIEVFGAKDVFFKWLALPNTALGGLEPSLLVEVPGGISKVRDIIGRIEHGVFS